MPVYIDTRVYVQLSIHMYPPKVRGKNGTVPAATGARRLLAAAPVRCNFWCPPWCVGEVRFFWGFDHDGAGIVSQQKTAESELIT